MSLWKVMSVGGVAARQVSAVERQAGKFVWGTEGFKWISGSGSGSCDSGAEAGQQQQQSGDTAWSRPGHAETDNVGPQRHFAPAL